MTGEFRTARGVARIGAGTLVVDRRPAGIVRHWLRTLRSGSVRGRFRAAFAVYPPLHTAWTTWRHLARGVAPNRGGLVILAGLVLVWLATFGETYSKGFRETRIDLGDVASVEVDRDERTVTLRGDGVGRSHLRLLYSPRGWWSGSDELEVELPDDDAVEGAVDALRFGGVDHQVVGDPGPPGGEQRDADPVERAADRA